MATRHYRLQLGKVFVAQSSLANTVASGGATDSVAPVRAWRHPLPRRTTVGRSLTTPRTPLHLGRGANRDTVESLVLQSSRRTSGRFTVAARAVVDLLARAGGDGEAFVVIEDGGDLQAPAERLDVAA